MVRSVLVLVVAIVGLAPVTTSAQTRVDLFDKKSARTGGVIVDERTGRVDVYDRDANRIGYGKLDRSTGRVELFDVRGNRVGTLSQSDSGVRERR